MANMLQDRCLRSLDRCQAVLQFSHIVGDLVDLSAHVPKVLNDDVVDLVHAGSLLRRLRAYPQPHLPLITTALPVYNTGVGRVDRYKGIPPFPETRACVARMLALYACIAHVHVFDECITAASPMLRQVATATALRNDLAKAHRSASSCNRSV